jgi:GNAT superfamily N-acetyltransferase
MASPEIVPFAAATASDAELRSWHAFRVCIHEEAWPDDPPPSLTPMMAAMRNPPAFEEQRRWAVWNTHTDAIVATASVGVWHAHTNTHLAQFDISVAPEVRRQGIARGLLAHVAVAAAEWSRRLLLSGSTERVLAGGRFMERIGARPGLRMESNELRLAGLDRALLREWLKQGEHRCPGFVLGYWDGPYPEAVIPDVIAMKEAANLMPRGDLEVEDHHPTREEILETDAAMAARGSQRWRLWARDPESGAIAGRYLDGA